MKNLTELDFVDLADSDDDLARESARPVILTTKATIEWAFKSHKAGSNLTNLDVLGLEGVRNATVSHKVLAYNGPGGAVTGLKPVTRKGVKMLTVALNARQSDVLRIQGVS